ncbi:amidohydrolase family protein [Emericellopsis atlantica]|uniref:Peptidase M20 domain-containing protein 2 n=1 Tax=Emericellopsis atlantica TaxID=2614577 RepID=A0A9P7ZWG5_9HYPO|nr:amidohydrolase family protein [Emericellopsis atlantica]KAG9258845.1 amidohydrolase family protein [Emericellopsis atlantica]
MDEEEDGFVLVPRHFEDDNYPSYLSDIEQVVLRLDDPSWTLNCYLHDNPELGFAEHKAHDALTKFMGSHAGWKITPSAYGMDTAWVAEYDTRRPGPVIAFNAEMDALPNLGHACGHNLIAVASVTAGIATAETLQRHKIGGKVLVIGTPAEEGGGGGKIKCLEAGAYDNVDVAIISHPGILNNSPMVRTTAYTHLDVSYRGRAAHAANSPWSGINALDALIVAYNAVSVLRQQTHPDDIIGLQITDGGNKPNVIHAHAAGVAVLRATSSHRLQELRRKVIACFQAGAEATGAQVHIEETPGYKDHVPNRVLAASYARYWRAMPDAPDPPLPPPGQYTWVKASTDQGNLSYALPSMNVSFAIPPGEKGGQPHSPDFAKASRTRGAFQRAMRVAKAMAGTAMDVCATPGLLGDVQAQWRRDMASMAGQEESPGNAASMA